ncbi:MAG: hypothetical protein LJE59_00740 [Chromatiaceae bacterium]|nr:hypothetical protein [Chromatiaceae bacterium]
MKLIPTTTPAVLSMPEGRLLGLALLLISSIATADDAVPDNASSLTDWFDSVYIQVGYGTHWNDSDDYTGTPLLGGIEAAHNDRHRIGIALFNNSFGQFSQYYYYGYKWQMPFIAESAYVKLSGGLIHGYKDEYEDRLPFNHSGWAPVIIPSLGWKHGRLGFDLAILGDAGLMFSVGYDAWQR